MAFGRKPWATAIAHCVQPHPFRNGGFILCIQPQDAQGQPARLPGASATYTGTGKDRKMVAPPKGPKGYLTSLRPGNGRYPVVDASSECYRIELTAKDDDTTTWVKKFADTYKAEMAAGKYASLIAEADAGKAATTNTLAAFDTLT